MIPTNLRVLFTLAAISLIVGVATTACGDEAASEGAPVFGTEQASDDECDHGGMVFRTGYDEDGDGYIDELTDRTVICHGGPGEDGDDGEDGPTSLMMTNAEGPGENCEHGGIEIEIGIDEDGDGDLGDEEIEDVEYVCNNLCSSGEPLDITVNTDDLPAQFSAGGTYTVSVDSDAEALAVDAVEPAGGFDIDVSYDAAEDNIVFVHNSGTGVAELALFITDGCDLTTKSVRLGPF